MFCFLRRTSGTIFLNGRYFCSTILPLPPFSRLFSQRRSGISSARYFSIPEGSALPFRFLTSWQMQKPMQALECRWICSHEKPFFFHQISIFKGYLSGCLSWASIHVHCPYRDGTYPVLPPDPGYLPGKNFTEVDSSYPGSSISPISPGNCYLKCYPTVSGPVFPQAWSTFQSPTCRILYSDFFLSSIPQGLLALSFIILW